MPYAPVLDEAAARRHFSIEGRPALRYDPLAYLVPAPDHSVNFRWEEHPDGRFVKRSNNLGFFEDEPTAIEKHGLRVLVAGDSHTSGLVNNAESFCNVAERELQRSLGRPDVEVLNAGVGYTSPTCYLGMLEKHLALDPDVFVAALFTGNDFCDEVFIGYESKRWPRPEPGAEYYARAAVAHERFRGPFWQGLNQAYRWKAFPAEPELALDSALTAYRAMKSLCDQRGIAFLAVLLPTKMDVDEDDRENLRAALDSLGLDERDLTSNLAAGRRFLEGARAAGIACLDPTEEMARSPEILYWKKDYHIAVRGHALLGGLLVRALEELL